MPTAKQFSYQHYTAALPDIKALKRSGQDQQLEALLWWCVAATEAESALTGVGVAPYYYEELAKLYRRRKDYQAEIAILEEYAGQLHAPGVSPARLLQRLERARERELASKASSH